MQNLNVQTRLERIDECFEHAALVCAVHPEVDPLLQQSLNDLVQRADAALDWLDQQRDPEPERLKRCIDDLEALSDQAWMAYDGGSAPELTRALEEARAELEQLKHQVH